MNEQTNYPPSLLIISPLLLSERSEGCDQLDQSHSVSPSLLIWIPSSVFSSSWKEREDDDDGQENRSLKGGTFYSSESEEETTTLILSVSVAMKEMRSVGGLGSIPVSWDMMMMMVVKGEENQTIEEGLDLWR